jgi:dihydrofolate synthase/folylpolyglutamate synthase
MSYATAIERLYALGQELHTAPGTPRRKFELAHMRALMAALGNAERTFATILVAGTNGKGSTASTLASILTRAGYRTGLYTSPHLSRVNERIQVSGSAIDDDDLSAAFFHVEEIASVLVQDGRLRRRVFSRHLPPWDFSILLPARCIRQWWKWAWAGGWTRPILSSRWCQ